VAIEKSSALVSVVIKVIALVGFALVQLAIQGMIAQLLRVLQLNSMMMLQKHVWTHAQLILFPTT